MAAPFNLREHRNIPRHLAQRADYRCEYCRLRMEITELPLELDHIIAKKHGGTDLEENLAVSCFYCNSYKGPNIAGVDPETKEVIRLFNPRNDSWEEHFHWNGPELVGNSAMARATLHVLAMNSPDAVGLRSSLIREGVQL